MLINPCGRFKYISQLLLAAGPCLQGRFKEWVLRPKVKGQIKAPAIAIKSGKWEFVRLVFLFSVIHVTVQGTRTNSFILENKGNLDTNPLKSQNACMRGWDVKT